MWAIIYYLLLLGGYYAGLTLTLFMLSPLHATFGFLARLLASYVSLVLAALAGVVISITFRLAGLGRSSQHATGRVFAAIMARTTGVRFIVEDPHGYLAGTRPAVFIGNHQTELDVLMLGTIFPRYCSVTAKKSLKRVPFLGWFMALSFSVFIDRADASSAKRVMSGAAQEMRHARQSVFMFPEGTRSYAKEPTLLPFKKGAFNLAVDAQVPLVPIVVACYEDVLHVQDWRFKSGRVLVKVLPPISTVGLKYEDVVDLARDTRELMLKELISVTARQRGRPIAMSGRQSTETALKASGSDVMQR